MSLAEAKLQKEKSILELRLPHHQHPKSTSAAQRIGGRPPQRISISPTLECSKLKFQTGPSIFHHFRLAGMARNE